MTKTYSFQATLSKLKTSSLSLNLRNDLSELCQCLGYSSHVYQSNTRPPRATSPMLSSMCSGSSANFSYARPLLSRTRRTVRARVASPYVRVAHRRYRSDASTSTGDEWMNETEHSSAGFSVLRHFPVCATGTQTGRRDGSAQLALAAEPLKPSTSTSSLAMRSRRMPMISVIESRCQQLP